MEIIIKHLKLFYARQKKNSQPTDGREDVGMETDDSRTRGRTSGASNTQTMIAVKSGKNSKKSNSTNDDEKVIKNHNR
ncbi:MAG: hypothetical protein ABJA90_11400 [Ginsengibacter sp.]